MIPFHLRPHPEEPRQRRLEGASSALWNLLRDGRYAASLKMKVFVFAIRVQTMTDKADIERLQIEAPLWFAALRDRICAAFEALEDEVTARGAPLANAPRAASSARRGSARTTPARPAAAASWR